VTWQAYTLHRRLVDDVFQNVFDLGESQRRRIGKVLSAVIVTCFESLTEPLRTVRRTVATPAEDAANDVIIALGSPIVPDPEMRSQRQLEATGCSRRSESQARSSSPSGRGRDWRSACPA